MKKILILIFALIRFTGYAQENTFIEIDSFNIRVNTIDKPYVLFSAYPAIPTGFIIDTRDTSDGGTNQSQTFTINYSGEGKKEIFKGGEIKLNQSTNFFSIQIDAVSQEILDELSKGKERLQVVFDNDVELKLIDTSKSPDVLKTVLVKSNHLKKLSINQLFISEEQKKNLVNAKGGSIYLLENKFDLGISPENADDKIDYYFSFAYATPLNIGLKVKERPLIVYVGTEGRIGTNASDPLNYLKLYPLNINLFQRTNPNSKKIYYEITATGGLEGNQNLTNMRYAGCATFRTLLPNLVNLTGGKSGRLRLKPVISFEAKYYKEQKNTYEFDNQQGAQLNAELYYYIPVLDKYSLTLNANAFYDFNGKLNPNNKIGFNYDAVFGVELPGGKIKTIAKYTHGNNGINYEVSNALLLGFIADFTE